MKGETRRYEYSGGTAIAAKREIAKNTYIVAIIPFDDRNISHRASVYADKIHGEDHGFPVDLSRWKINRAGYKCIVSGEIIRNKKIAPQVAKLVNKAVIRLSDDLESTKSKEDAVLGALEANKDVHEDGE